MNLDRRLASLLSTNAHCLLLVALFAFLAGGLCQLLPTTSSVSFMDPVERQSFLAAVDAEEEWLDNINRRLSSSSLPPHTPTPPTQETDSRSAAGPVRRSGRKRKSTVEIEGQQRRKMSSSQPPEKTVLEQLKDMMKEMKEVREDVNRSEASTSTKIDTLTKKMTDRLGTAEQSVKCLSQDMATVMTDIGRLKRRTAMDESKLEKVVEAAVDRKLATVKTDGLRRPRRPLTGANLITPEPRSGGDPREKDYFKARRSLKLWPVSGDDLRHAALTFVQDKLLLPKGRLLASDLEVSELYSPPDSNIKNQVLVLFPSIRTRDEVKALSRNLGGDTSAGIQLELPDYLRGKFQTFQSLAYQMKKKYPALKRNIKFVDATMGLVMDVKLDATSGWKAVQYEDANAILPQTRPRSSSFSRTELVNLLPQAGKSAEKKSDGDDSSDMDDDDTFVDIVSSDENTDKQNYSRSSFAFLNTNARSLGPKIESLFDCMHERKSDIAMVTETWYQSTKQGNEDIDDYAARYSLGAITRNRDSVATNGRQYGGVAFFFRTSCSSFREFVLDNPEGYEVLATIGNVKGVRGKIFCLTAYEPPNITLLRARQMHEYISDVIDEAKRVYADCMVLVAGDFNHWPAEEIVEDHVEFQEVTHGNTRGNRSIDRTFCNFPRAITESGTLPPLETESGLPSDHRIAFGRAVFTRPKVPTVKYSYRHYTDQGAIKFQELLSTQSWETVFSAVGPSEKVLVFQQILDSIMGLCFLMKTTVKRVCDPPWVNNKIRKLSRKRRKVYDREGRSPRWKALKKQCKELYSKRAATYMEEQKKVLTAPDASRSFFKNVKAYQSREKPPSFDVRELYPEESDENIASHLADHFNAISSEFQGLIPDQVPEADPGFLPYLSILDVAGRLSKFRKPKSTVKGDIFPCLVNRSAPLLAIPLTHIFNCISINHEWPDVWKVEYVTPIPKKNSPQTVNDLRNISCTQLFSKIYESFVLEWLTSQVKLRRNQYGGVKGRGTEHFLVNLWQQVLEDIEDSRAAALLTSIDYAKAFNRLDFMHCLNCLKTKGANGKLLRIVASFLSGRVMRVKVGDTLSPPRPVLGEVPQGSLLGVFLFNLSIDDFEAYSPDVESYSGLDQAITDPAPGQPIDAYVPPEPSERDHRHTTPFVRKLLQVLKYVDDNILIEKLNFDTVATDGHFFRSKLAVRTQNLFRRIVHQARAVGMKIHPGKTIAMCIAELKSYNPLAFFYDSDGAKVQTVQTMKILGVTFSSDPDMRAQVESIRKKFRARKWILHHLGHRGFSKEDLLAVYKSTILPVHDYCSCVFNSSLTLSQVSMLERLQSQALKAIYGYEHSYRSLLELSGLQRLQERRDDRCEKFARKCLNDDTFRHWFPLNPVERVTRNPLVYQESRARTKRLMNSPIYHMRRILNGKGPVRF